MSLVTNKSKSVYTGNGTIKAFAFYFKAWRPEEVLTLVRPPGGEEAAADVTVELAESGGKVVFKEAPAKGSGVVIMRNMPFTQEDSFADGMRFDPSCVEERLDRDCAERQQLYEAVSRAVMVPVTSGMSAEEYRAAYLQKIADYKDDALSALAVRSSEAAALISAKASEAEQARDGAAAAQGRAEAASRASEASAAQARALYEGEISGAVTAAQNSAKSAGEYAADVEGRIIDAAQEAADCLIRRMKSSESRAGHYAASAASAACQAVANGEKTWRMVRAMTRKAGEEAAACILERAERGAAISGINSKAAAASAACAAGLAADMAAIIHMKALEAAELAVSEACDCLANICQFSAEQAAIQAGSAAKSAAAGQAALKDVQKTIGAYAENAARDVCERAAGVIGDMICQAVKACQAYAASAAADARTALGHAVAAKQADVCEEAAQRRAADEELLKRIEALEARA